MGFVRTNYRIHVVAEVQDDTVDSGAIVTGAVDATHMAAAALDNLIARGSKTSATADASGLITVSTGLTSPVRGMGIMRSSTATGTSLNARLLKFYKCTGTYAYFRLLKTTATGNPTILTGTTVGFDWASWET